MTSLVSSNLRPDTPFNMRAKCAACNQFVDVDLLGCYEDHRICDDCAEHLKPRWYNASRREIIAAAKRHSVFTIGVSSSKEAEQEMIRVIEDDNGDIVDSSPNCSELFTGQPTPRETTTDYLPEHERGLHRRLHRRAIESLMPDQYELIAKGRPWTVEFYPFREQGGVFSLTLFTNGHAESAQSL
jgi:hypothetical protein